jgi:RNA polymerase sigma-70 factor (ECF subfamily)
MDTKDVWLKFQEGLKKFLIRRVQDEKLAEDLLQDTFLKIQENIANIEDHTRIGGWVYRIAHNVIADHFRKERKNQKLEKDVFEVNEKERIDSGNVKMEEMVAWLPFAIENLPEKYRDAVRLTEIEGLSQKELAGRLGISYSGAKSRVQRGREKLKEQILLCCQVETDPYGNIVDYQPRGAGCGEC